MTTLLTYNMGIQAFDERDYKTAIERFSTVLEEDPRNLNVREYLARAHYHRASLRPAEAEARTILEQDPTNEFVTLLLIRSLERQNRADEAVGLRRRLAALTGDDSHLTSQSL